ncbi:MAG: TldD/PmbA family protein [Candidatus Riflebacteria bacterium]|nr:TldD/PmbA family protein [Candidatus Riflebacteria bacterium]
MLEKLRKILSRIDADYADLRHEVKRETKIRLDCGKVQELSCCETDGYLLRILKGGGFANVAFIRPDQADTAIKFATENAIFQGNKLSKPVRLADVPVVKDRVVAVLDRDPRKIDTREKLELLCNYDTIPKSSKKVIARAFTYADISREKCFVSTEGTEVSEDLVTNSIQGLITAREGTLTQNIRLNIGGGTGFGSLINREAVFEERTRIVEGLLTAEPGRGGVQNVVLSPLLAGVFAHEAFGHSSEADTVENSTGFREKMSLGTRLGSEVVNIVDEPTRRGLLGYYRFDDEGVEARKTDLMRAGVLTGRLHCRRTAAAFGEPITGHAIAEDFRYPPLVRMGTIYIEPGTATLDELLEKCGEGLYIVDARGGQTAGESFTFAGQFGYKISGGKKTGLVRDLNISGNLFKTLESVALIGNDLKFSEAGSCGKGQANIRSCLGSPSILVRDVVVGGV